MVRIAFGLDQEVLVSSFFFSFSHMFSIHHTSVCPLWSNNSKMATKDKGVGKGTEDSAHQQTKSVQGVQQNEFVIEETQHLLAGI